MLKTRRAVGDALGAYSWLGIRVFPQIAGGRLGAHRFEVTFFSSRVEISSTIREYTMLSTIRPLSSSIMSSGRGKAASTRLTAINRQFSSSPMAFEVKKLGVVGAGQMV